MLKGRAKGRLIHHKIDSGNFAAFEAQTGFQFLYLASGTLRLEDGLIVHSGDLISIDKVKTVIHTLEPCDLIEIQVEDV